MTEEILQSAILRLKSKATEQFAIIKDLYHRPATPETVDKIAQHSLLLAQYEGGMITLQQYSPMLAEQTDGEASSNLPEELAVETEPPVGPSNEEILERSATYRKSKALRVSSMKAKKSES
jgi:hypothetical protein|tara:strand:- start:1002 stop:1364 length:363 start_codon:yes stop_codon:yes gene_type:complete